MQKNQKDYLRDWECNKKFKLKGGTICLSNLISDARTSKKNPTGESLPDYLCNVHPWLYYNYVIDWSRYDCDKKLPIGYKTGEELGRYVIAEWQKECFKKKFFRTGILDVYDNIDQLRTNDTRLLTVEDDQHKSIRLISLPGGYEEHVNRLYEIRQEQLDQETRDHDAQQAILQAERDKALAENRVREANHLLEEANRNRAAAIARKQAIDNKQFYDRQNSPWTADVTAHDDGESSPASSPSSTVIESSPTSSPSLSIDGDSSPSSSPSPSPSAGESSTSQSPVSESSTPTSTYDTSVSSVPVNITATSLDYKIRHLVDIASAAGIHNRKVIIEYRGGDIYYITLTSGSGDDTITESVKGHTLANAFENAKRRNKQDIADLLEAEQRRKAEEEARIKAEKEKERTNLQAQLDQLLAAANLLKQQIESI